MDFVFDNERPIYLQISSLLRTQIVSAKFQPGEKLPSVRELALAAKVNPNTVQKALTELENEGLIYTERTNGKFVSSDANTILIAKNALAKEKAAKFFEEMQNIGYSDTEALNYINHFGGEGK